MGFLYAYALVFYALFVWRSIDLSSGKEAWGLRGLRRGWILERNDLSDAQWRNFRANLPALTIVLGGFTVLSLILTHGLRFGGKGMSRYWLVVSTIFLAYMHECCIVFIVAIAAGNFALTKVIAGGRSFFPILLWSYNLAFLILNRVYEGYSFTSLGYAFARLDKHRGAMRWHISFNFVMLRMVSFGLDYHWTRCCRPSAINWEKHNATCSECQTGNPCYLSRQEKVLPANAYGLTAYFSYLFYAPLYIAGPVVSFNSFSSQASSFRPLSFDQAGAYGIRWLACLLLMELMTHYFYYNAFATSRVWPKLSPVQIFIVGYGVLNFMWLKFLLIWRFFRFWALMSGVESPENMLRCVNNCYDLEGFWKSWHASYNRWLVRYIYIPLGGSRWKLLNVWIIFTFVALWHDLEWKLLSWAWMTCLLWLPEGLMKLSLRLKQVSCFYFPLFTEGCAIASALNITGLMMANLIGFVVGPAGFKELISKLFVKQNAWLCLGIFFSFYVGAKVRIGTFFLPFLLFFMHCAAYVSSEGGRGL
ncbi:hypothetical protein SELMODRAFT_99787 [Selaginella moellendorffii]|uniref:Membrane-bound O-acyltransferase C24H6.01c n=1 Tax=Selaginella moellendorffii TaxID=88036 RepID=D8RRF2_SELML|nr:hypothetical protein SELMODRAFT_99787 [Selaginella moellendorffii]